MKSGWQTSEWLPRHVRLWWCRDTTKTRRESSRLYVPLTSEDRGSEYEVEMPKLPFLRLEGVANVQGIGSLAVKRLERRLGVLPTEVMERIKKALRFALDLE